MTDRQTTRSYYNGLHSEQCGRAVKKRNFEYQDALFPFLSINLDSDVIEAYLPVPTFVYLDVLYVDAL